jgi:hypothetical protein
MFIINVNTRLLVVYPIPNKSTNEIFKVLDEFITDFANNKPIYFKGDGEKGFAAAEKMMRGLNLRINAHFYLRPKASQGGYRLTNSFNLIDSVIRSIRNLVGKVSQYNPSAFGDTTLMPKVVQITLPLKFKTIFDWNASTLKNVKRKSKRWMN